MRLPLLAATLGMVCILTLDLFVFDPTQRQGREEMGAAAQEAAEAAAKEEDKKEEETLLFSQTLWDNVVNDDDWDAVSYICCVNC
jgi:hypothetical protein